MARPSRFPPEVRERAVRWCSSTPRPTRRSGRRSPRSPRRSGVRPRRCGAGCDRPSVTGADKPGLTTDERARVKQLERENVELRRANEILRLASAYFAKAELPGRFTGEHPGIGDSKKSLGRRRAQSKQHPGGEGQSDGSSPVIGIHVVSHHDTPIPTIDCSWYYAYNSGSSWK